MLRVLRLGLCGLAASTICSAYLYFFQPRSFYAAYRCLTAARPWYACFLYHEYSFSTDLFGMIYEGHVGKGDYVDEMILSQGSYETHILFFLRDSMAKLNPRDGVFIDVGANSGQHSMFMSRYAKAVHAFEPFPPVLARFRRMLELNKITNVIVHPVGLGRESTRLPFNDQELSFSQDAVKRGHANSEFEIVPGDLALKAAGVARIDLVKMDIEGFEKAALQGLKKTLRRDRPVVVFELRIDPAHPWLFSSAADVRGAFPANYEFLVFGLWDFYSGFYEFADLTRTARFGTETVYNAVAYPQEKKDSIALKSSAPKPTSLR